MFNMQDSITARSTEEGKAVFLFFKPNREFGFYYSKELVNLKKFANEVEKVELVDCYENVYSNSDETYGDITGGYVKVYYKDGTHKILDFCLNNDWEYDFFEISA